MQQTAGDGRCSAVYHVSSGHVFYGYRMETVIVAGLLACLIIVLHRSSFRKEVKVEDDYRAEYQNLGKNIAYYRAQKTWIRMISL